MTDADLFSALKDAGLPGFAAFAVIWAALWRKRERGDMPVESQLAVKLDELTKEVAAMRLDFSVKFARLETELGRDK